MKKESLIYLFFTIMLFGCSSSNDDNDDNSNTNDSVYFNFTFEGKNYSSTVDGGLLCMVAVPNEIGSKVDIIMNHNNPSDNTTTCGVSLLSLNNGIGTTNNCIFSLSSGDYYITCNNTKVILTEIGDFYVGTFSGDINITDFNVYSETIPGSGSFRVRKSFN